MLRYIIAALLTGISFATMDGLINGNPFAVKLLECYQPIARQSINVPLALFIDLFYGFMISAIFIIVLPVLPTTSGIMKGIMFGGGIWFFRVLMSVISSWMMFVIPEKTLVYMALTGLIEMVLLGILNGLIVKTKTSSQ